MFKVWPRIPFYKTGHDRPHEISQGEYLMSSKCNQCSSEIKWKKPFVKGDRPLNLDDSTHTCKKPDTPSTGITQNAVTSMTVLAEIEAFREKFASIESDARFDALARIYISRMMKR